MATIDAGFLPGGLRLSVAGGESIDIETPAGEPSLSVVIWKDTLLATPASTEAAHWLSAVLGRPCRPVYMPNPEIARQADLNYARPGDHVSFADSYAALVVTDASLRALNGKLETPVPMTRFRPNIVISGATAWEENSWIEISIGTVPFRGVKPCARCVVTTIDQVSGHKADNGEPLRTLAKINRSENGRIVFGENLVTMATGIISVDDAVTVGSRRR